MGGRQRVFGTNSSKPSLPMISTEQHATGSHIRFAFAIRHCFRIPSTCLADL
jgi:hypothetical protein